MSWEGDKPVVTFPIPGVPGATATATLDAKYMTERVVVKQGIDDHANSPTSDYQDWNNPLNKIEVFYAGKMVGAPERRGRPRPDHDETETGNVYVVAPVPASVKAAMKVTGQIPQWRVSRKEEPPVDKSKPTPRMGEHPDLTGNWAYNDWIGNYMTGGGRRCGPTQDRTAPRQDNQTYDFELYSPSRFGGLGRPTYKPEYWDKVQELDMWTNKNDPVMTCQPLGVPREGPPRRIYQTDKDVVFFYTEAMPAADTASIASSRPMAASTIRRERSRATYLGYTVGHWEGDTLVLDSISFVDTTWLGRGGFIHSDTMHVVERFTRQGDVILYDVTVEDPEVLVEPWVLPTRIMRRNANPDAGLLRSGVTARCTKPRVSRRRSAIRGATSNCPLRVCVDLHAAPGSCARIPAAGNGLTFRASPLSHLCKWSGVSVLFCFSLNSFLAFLMNTGGRSRRRAKKLERSAGR